MSNRYRLALLLFLGIFVFGIFSAGNVEAVKIKVKLIGEEQKILEGYHSLIIYESPIRPYFSYLGISGDDGISAGYAFQSVGDRINVSVFRTKEDADSRSNAVFTKGYIVEGSWSGDPYILEVLTNLVSSNAEQEIIGATGTTEQGITSFLIKDDCQRDQESSAGGPYTTAKDVQILFCYKNESFRVGTRYINDISFSFDAACPEVGSAQFFSASQGSVYVCVSNVQSSAGEEIVSDVKVENKQSCTEGFSKKGESIELRNDVFITLCLKKAKGQEVQPGANLGSSGAGSENAEQPALPTPQGLIMVYREYLENEKDGFLTTDSKEVCGLEPLFCAYPANVNSDNLTVLYRLFNKKYPGDPMFDHFYTSDENEKNNVVNSGEWNNEGILVKIFKNNSDARLIPLYRYNHSSSDFFDHDYLLNSTPPRGYGGEGIVGYVYNVSYCAVAETNKCKDGGGAVDTATGGTIGCVAGAAAVTALYFGIPIWAPVGCVAGAIAGGFAGANVNPISDFFNNIGKLISDITTNIGNTISKIGGNVFSGLGQVFEGFKKVIWPF